MCIGNRTRSQGVPSESGSAAVACFAIRLQARWISEAFFRMFRAGVSVASWFQMRDGSGDDARFADGLYTVCPGQPLNPSCDRPKVSFDSFRTSV